MEYFTLSQNKAGALEKAEGRWILISLYINEDELDTITRTQ